MALSRGGGRGALLVAALPPRRLLSVGRDGAAGAARARAPARGARARRAAVRGHARDADRGRARRDGGRTRASAGGRRRNERLDDRLAPGRPAADELRQLRRPHRAGAGRTRRDRLDGRRGDRRRAHVPALLPDDRGRAGADGLRARGRSASAAASTGASRTTRRPSRAPRQGLRELLPGLAGAKIERAWGGPIDVSSDHLPFFGTVPGTRIHYGAGYSGNGVGPSWLGGQILASLVLGADDEWSRLPLATRRVPSFPPEPVRRLGGGLVRWGILARRGGRGAGPPPAARRALRRVAPAPPRPARRDALGLRPNTCSLRTCPSDCPMGQSLRRGCWGHGRCPGFPCSWGRSMDAGRGRRRRLGTGPCPTA